ncbi:alpha/beta hydrolase [Subtercola boreus]|nr:alpha/beta hydrolase [Subtercola boreus]
MTAIPRRVRAWGWVMDRFPSMHIATMSPAEIAHNQTMQHVPAFARRLLFGTRHRGVLVDDRSLPTPAGDLPVRIYRPAPGMPLAGARARRAIAAPDTLATPAAPRPGTPPAAALPIALYFHGGGWTLFGALDMCDWLPSRVAVELGAIVIAVDYRLAPEHPFPAAVDDAYSALEWAAANAVALGGDPDRLAVFGDSAGGNLAAVLTQLSRDRGGPPIAAQGLIYPVTDTDLDDRSMRQNARKPVLHQTDMRRFFDLYLGDGPADPVRSDARAAPLLTEDLSGLPPALLQLAAHDVLRDQGIRYAERLVDAGVLTEVLIYPEATHGWVTYPGIMAVSRRASNDLVRFLRTHT